MAVSNSSDEIGERASGDTSSDPVKVTLIADEWLSKKGGLSTINRELSMQLANSINLKVSLFMRESDREEKNRAEECNVAIIESQMPNEEEWWKYPPTNFKTDFVIGHGAKLGKQAEYLRDNFQCKWVQVVHTEPEELSSSKGYPGAGAKGEEKSKEEVRLCRNADMVVGIGLKLTEVYSAKLRPDKEVFELTPGIFKEFVKLKQAPSGGGKFRVLIFGRGDPEDTSLKGYDLAAKSIAQLHVSDNSIYLIFMGVQNQEHDQVRERLLGHGLLKERFIVRSFCESRQELGETFQQVDLAIMPSRSEGFGLAALEALSAGLPILIGWNTGLAEALKKVPNGRRCIVKTDDPGDWATAISGARHDEREIRLEEARRLREDYEKTYPWDARCEMLVEEMLKLGRHDLVEVSTVQHVITAPHQASSNQLQEFREERSYSKGREEGLRSPNPPKRLKGDDQVIGQLPSTSGCASSQLNFKVGVPDDRELLKLSSHIQEPVVWERVGILLGLSRNQISDIKSNASDKAFQMLLDWRSSTNSQYHYQDLYNALCDSKVRKNNVAKKFCLI